MQQSRMPVLFVSHGSPELALCETAAHQFLKRFGGLVVRPRAILMVSAHWETARPTVATDMAPETIYDFGAFDPRLRQIVYPAPRACALTERAVDLLARASFDIQKDNKWGYDHGVWIPLKLIYPEADIPIAQVSIQPSSDPWHHFRLGQSLRALRDEGILVITSGALTHNLAEFRGQTVDSEPRDWVVEFNDWLSAGIQCNNHEALLNYRTRAPHAERNHPSDEHLLPFFVALGAAGNDVGERLHASYEYGIIAMDVYAFGDLTGGHTS